MSNAQALKPGQIFQGLAEPFENFYRLPCVWFEMLVVLSVAYTGRFVAAIKVLEYIIRHTWGYQQFDGTIRLSVAEIRNGVKRRGKRIDYGTGLSENAIRKALAKLTQLNYIDVFEMDGNKFYRVRINQINSDEPVEGLKQFYGFPNPLQSYFKVPCYWIYLMQKINSVSTILVVEYLFRHSWGYHNEEGIWLDAEEIAYGRRKSSGGHYDEGTRLDISSVYRGLKDAITQGLVVWDRGIQNGRIRYNLRLVGMEIDPKTGEYLGNRLEEDDDEIDLNFPKPELPLCNPIRNVEVSIRKNDVPICNNSVPICEDDLPVGNDEEKICDIAGETPVLKDNNLKNNLDTNKTPVKGVPPELNNLSLSTAVISPSGIEIFLKSIGIGFPACRDIPKIVDSWDTVMAWTLFAFSKVKSDQYRLGFLINRLKENIPPDEEYLFFAQMTISEWNYCCKKCDFYSYSQENVMDKYDQWRRVFAKNGLSLLPKVIRDVLQKANNSICPQDLIDIPFESEAIEQDEYIFDKLEKKSDTPMQSFWQQVLNLARLNLGSDKCLQKMECPMEISSDQKLLIPVKNEKDCAYLQDRFSLSLERIVSGIRNQETKIEFYVKTEGMV